MCLYGHHQQYFPSFFLESKNEEEEERNDGVDERNDSS
jgi:hypothetical protein